jgi:hypothetical protein
MGEFSKGDRVRWSWGNGTGEGTVQAVYTDEVTKEIEGTEVTRKADSDNPAYLIQQDDDARVLKSESELSRA